MTFAFENMKIRLKNFENEKYGWKIILILRIRDENNSSDAL